MTLLHQILFSQLKASFLEPGQGLGFFVVFFLTSLHTLIPKIIFQDSTRTTLQTISYQ